MNTQTNNQIEILFANHNREKKFSKNLYSINIYILLTHAANDIRQKSHCAWFFSCNELTKVFYAAQHLKAKIIICSSAVPHFC